MSAEALEISVSYYPFSLTDDSNSALNSSASPSFSDNMDNISNKTSSIVYFHYGRSSCFYENCNNNIELDIVPSCEEIFFTMLEYQILYNSQKHTVSIFV